MSLHVVNFIFPAVSYLQVHNFCALVDTNGEGVVVFGGHQDLLEGSAGALSMLGGFLDQDLLKSHDEGCEDIPLWKSSRKSEE